MDHLAAARRAYDAIADSYAEHFAAEFAGQEWEHAALRDFAQSVPAAVGSGDGTGGPVLDAGCGPGWTTAHLHALGADVRGTDLSPEMVRVARARNPGLRFDTGSMDALPDGDRAFAGIVAWYSVIHTPPERMAAVFAEFHRVLRPGGALLLAFQVGDGALRLDQAFGHRMDVDFHRWEPDRIAALLTAAGFAETERRQRPAHPHERTPQAVLFARRSAEPGSAGTDAPPARP
ncbi:class I SAM-dependent DNA methyltransferase [Nocardiopsis coralliicola]